MSEAPDPIIDLRGTRGLVIWIANIHSIVAGCATAFSHAGAMLAATTLNAKSEPFVRAVTDRIDCPLVLPCDVRVPGQLEAVFERSGAEWGHLHFVLHFVAFAPAEDLYGRVMDSSAAGFALAMDVSRHSFLRVARLAELLVIGGDCLLAVTFYGSARLVEHHNLMGLVKAALGSSLRYAEAGLGPRHPRPCAVPPAAPHPGRQRDRPVRRPARRRRRSLPNAAWSISRTSTTSRPSLSATPPGTSPGQSSRSTAGSTCPPELPITQGIQQHGPA